MGSAPGGTYVSSTRTGQRREDLASVCGVLNASYARLVTIAARVLADESWASGGVRSPEHWLTCGPGLSPFHARAVVALARRAGELPTVMGEFADGQLSLDQVAVVARYAPAHVEASMAEFAVHATVPQLRRALSRYSFDPPAATSANEQDQQAAAADTGAGDTEPGDIQAGDTQCCDTATGETGGGETGGGETGAGDTGVVGTGTWNGFALPEDRGTAPAQLSISCDEQGRFTMRFSAPADRAPWLRPR